MSRSRGLLIGVGAAALVAAAPPVAQGSVGGPTGPCTPGLGVGLVDVPRSEDPRAQTYIVDHVEPGSSFRRRFQVCNGTRSPVTVQLYPGAAVVEDGAFTIVDGRAENELSKWITIAPTVVRVDPGERILATATLTVPGDATGGERYAALLAELPPSRGANGVAVANRVGVRVYLSVGGPRAPESDFVIDSLQASRRADGTPMVTAEVRNTGARALDLRGELALTDGPGGLSGGPFPAQLGTTLVPGDVEPVTVVLDKAITGGPWTATLTLKSGLLERQARAQITFPDEAGEAAAPVAAENLSLGEDPKILVPIAGGLIGLIALLLLYLLLRRRTRTKGEKDAEPAEPPA